MIKEDLIKELQKLPDGIEVALISSYNQYEYNTTREVEIVEAAQDCADMDDDWHYYGLDYHRYRMLKKKDGLIKTKIAVIHD